MRRQRDKGNKIGKFMVYFMGFIMIGSLFGIIFLGFGGGGNQASPARISYNDLEFFNRGSFWSTNVNGIEALFTYPPTDLELIIADNSAIDRLKNRVQIDVTSDFNDTYAEGIALAQYQMGITLNNFNIFSRSGFTTAQGHNLPVFSCSSATINVPVVYFKSGNSTRIYIEDNCIIAESVFPEDVIRIKDRLVYGILGIIR